MGTLKDIHIAKAAGVSPATVSMIRNGKRRASAKTAKKLEEASGIHRDFWLYPGEFDRDGNPIPPPPAEQSPEVRL